MKITLHLPMSLPGGIAYDLTTPAELRDLLSWLTSPEGYADDSPSTVTLSADAAYTLAALAVRGESLPRTDEERHTAENHNPTQAALAVANT